MIRAALLIALVLSAGTARAASVIVFPLDARGVSYDTADTATKWALETIRMSSGAEVIEPSRVEREIGVKLTEQARACDYDVFCLVEVGEILQGDKMLVGHVRLVTGKEGDRHELKLIVLDVSKATIVEVLIWKLPAVHAGALEHAVRAATKRLFAKPDALVSIDLSPENARLSFFGDPVQLPKDGSPLPYWSGTYYALVEAEGYHSKELRVAIPKSEAATRIPIELEQDPLFVPERGQKKTQPFARASRREGSGATADVVGAVPEDHGPKPILLTAWPWVTAAVGIGLGVGGTFLTTSAQSTYNDLSTQERYRAGVTVTADVAIDRRDDARMRFRTGSGLMFAGGAVLLGTALWVIIDWALTPRAP